MVSDVSVVYARSLMADTALDRGLKQKMDFLTDCVDGIATNASKIGNERLCE